MRDSVPAVFFTRLSQSVAHTSAAEIRAAIKSYQETDDGAAAKLDASYPEVDLEGPSDGTTGMSAQGWRQGGTFSVRPQPEQAR